MVTVVGGGGGRERGGSRLWRLWWVRCGSPRMDRKPPRVCQFESQMAHDAIMLPLLENVHVSRHVWGERVDGATVVDDQEE